MKCYGIKEKDIRKAAQEEYNKKFANQAEEISVQTVATVLYALSLQGYGKKRLRRVFDGIKDTDRLMSGGIFGREFDGYDCEKLMAEKYGINIRKEMKLHVEVR